MKSFGGLWILILLLFMPLTIALPSMPYEAWGRVTINGEPAQDGLSVKAYINGVRYATTSTISGYYSISIQGDDPDTPEKEGGVNGDIITIKVNDNSALPALTWQEGLTERVDLRVETGEQGNHAPVLNHISDITLIEGDLVDIDPSASDEDNDQLTFTFTSPLNSNGRWQTQSGDAGTYTVTVTVSDGELTDSQQVHITVNQQQDNNEDNDQDNNQDNENQNNDDNQGNENNNLGIVYQNPSNEKNKKNPIKISTIREINTNNIAAGDMLSFDIGFQNTGDKKMKDVKITVIIKELNVFSSLGPFDIKKGDSLYETITLDIPEDAEPGEYYVKMTIASGNQRIVKYRPIYIE